MQPSHPTRPIFRELTRRYSGGGPVLRTLNRRSKAAFSGRPGAPASALLHGPRFRSGSARGPLSGPPRMAVQGRFFGAPRGPPPACCSAARDFSLAARAGAGRYLGPPNSGPRPLFRGAPGAPASELLRGPRFRSGSAIFYPQHGFRSQQRQKGSCTTNSGSASCTSR